MSKITISKKSWHYRFVDYFFGLKKREKPLSLCTYMHLFFWSVAGALGIGAVALCFVGVILFAVYSLTAGEYYAYQRIVNDAPIDLSELDRYAAMTASMTDLMAGVALALFALCSIGVIFGWISRLSFLVLIWEYIKAIKNRVCPILEIKP